MQNIDNSKLTWHYDQWARLLPQGRQSLERLPHGLLLSGGSGLGKRVFAHQLAALLLCESEDRTLQLACGGCEACGWLKEGNHPDFRRLSSTDDAGEDDVATEGKEKKKGAAQIKIGAVRELEDFVFVGSHRRGSRVVVVEEAETMNAPAANAILKILEEPPPSVYFILTTSRPRLLLPTIRSRCQMLHFKAPAVSEWTAVAKQLNIGGKVSGGFLLTGGAPLTLLEWQQNGLLDALESISRSLGDSGPKDPLSLASAWEGLVRRHAKLEMEMLVEQVLREVFDAALAGASGRARFHPAGSETRPANHATRHWSELLRLRRSARHPLNPTLFLEDLATQTLRSLRPETA